MIYDKNEINPDVKKNFILAMQLEELNHPGVLSVTTSYNSAMLSLMVFFTYEQLLELEIKRNRKTKII